METYSTYTSKSARLSDLGTVLENSLYQPTDPNDSITNELRVSSFRNKFNFRYSGETEVLIDISIVKVNGAQMLSTQTTIPTIDMVEPLNDLYEYWPSTMRQSLDYKYQRIAHKRVRMRASSMYTNAHLNSGQNSAVTVPATYREGERHVSLHKSFKGAGMKLHVENSVRAPQTEYFLLVASSRPIEFTCITAIRFRLEKASQISQPGNS